MTTQLSATQFQDTVIKTFATMALAIADENLEEGDVLLIKDRANSHWDVVLSSGVTENSYNIVQGVGVPTLSLVLRTTGTNIEAAWFGAAGGVDSTGAIQAAVDYALSLNTLGGHGYQWTPKVVLPPGRMIVTGEIEIDDTKEITITGAGMTATILDCSTGAAFRSVFYTGANQSTFHKFAKFAIYGGSDIQYGIYAPFADHVVYSELRVSYTTVAGIYHKYGWSSDFERCELCFNSGHGLMIENNANAANIVGCKLYSNTGFGLWASQSLGVKVFGGTVEANEAGGIMLNIISGFNISTYFENNGATGYTYTTPAVTVKADVILNESGTPTTTINQAGGTAGEFTGCVSSPSVNNNCIVYIGACRSLGINGWHLNDDTATSGTPFFRGLVNSSYAHARNVDLNRMTRDAGRINADIDLSDYTVPTGCTWADTHTYSRTTVFDLGATHGADPTTYANISAGATAMTLALEATYKDGVPIYSSVQTGGGSSHVYGYSVPTSDVSNHNDKFCYVTFWAKAVTGTPGIGVFIDTGTSGLTNTGGESALVNGTWTKITKIFKCAASGNIRIGIRHANGSASDKILWTRPVVSVVGNDSKKYGVGVF